MVVALEVLSSLLVWFWTSLFTIYPKCFPCNNKIVALLSPHFVYIVSLRHQASNEMLLFLKIISAKIVATTRNILSLFMFCQLSTLPPRQETFPLKPLHKENISMN